MYDMIWLFTAYRVPKYMSQVIGRMARDKIYSPNNNNNNQRL